MPSSHSTDNQTRSEAHPLRNLELLLFLASFLTLYFELLVIRYLSTEIRVFAYLKNMALVASFLGIGIGMILGSRTQPMRKAFPGLATFFFLMIWACTQAGANHLGLPTSDYGIWDNYFRGDILGACAFFAFVGGFLYIVVRFFIPLGGLVGEYMAQEQSPLRAYALNLFGSLAGILAFTLLSFCDTPPWVWLSIGFILLLPLLPRSYTGVGLLAVTVLLTTIAVRPEIRSQQQYWSPYYHIFLGPPQTPPGASTPAYYLLNVNYDYHQKILNLSDNFLARYPEFEPNRSALTTYNLPFQLAPNLSDVLIVGAGTGNDVAAALRNGAHHVDAVEIDSTILNLGRQFHPEHPYSSPRVTTYVNDARAFFRQARHKYDLVEFSYLDSHTMFSSFSSLRLDNYVYTKESLEDARSLLKPNGSLILSFDSGRSLVTPRIFETLKAAFGTEPRVFETNYDTGGIVFVEGDAKRSTVPTAIPEITNWVREYKVALATDSWPFLYLPRHRIPWPIVSVLFLFVCAALFAVRRLIPFKSGGLGENTHFFLLGAGFLLLETRGITELSLLFGSTWAVNSIVISAFLCMSLLSNLVVMRHRIPVLLSYICLLTSTLLSAAFPYAILNSHSLPVRIVVAAVLTAMPVFFSGIVFSRSLALLTNCNQALGVNLIGAIVGGALESTVMIGGTGILAPLAILLYLGSAVPLMTGKISRRYSGDSVAVGSS